MGDGHASVTVRRKLRCDYGLRKDNGFERRFRTGVARSLLLIVNDGAGGADGGCEELN